MSNDSRIKNLARRFSSFIIGIVARTNLSYVPIECLRLPNLFTKSSLIPLSRTACMHNV